MVGGFRPCTTENVHVTLCKGAGNIFDWFLNDVDEKYFDLQRVSKPHSDDSSQRGLELDFKKD